MRLRPAKESDAEAVTVCVRTAYRHYIRRMGKRPGPMRRDYRQVIREHKVAVAEDGGRLVGVVVLITTHRGFVLDNVAVHPAEQGRGIGVALLAHAEAEARRAGYRSINLYTHVTMTENRALYASLGYEEHGRRTEQGFARVYMRKRLR